MNSLLVDRIAVSVLALSLIGGIGSSEVLAQAPSTENRTIDGVGNNLDNPDYGSAGIQLLRMGHANYPDGMTPITDPDLASARAISNAVAAQEGSVVNPVGASDFIWQWGQFLDHDIDLTTEALPAEPLPIPVPAGDPFFDPAFTGTAVIGFSRSIYNLDTGTKKNNPRQQLNLITSFIDASNVYGSDGARASFLRTNDGTGKLKSTNGEYLPFNTAGFPNAGGPDPDLFLAGDVRANEQIYLTAMHTLFMREHNRLCDEIAANDPGLSGEEIYQRARRIVGAQMQVISYNEFLPVLLGPNALPAYGGYDPDVNPAISNKFSTAAYRYGHSQLSPTLLRINRGGKETLHIKLKDAFFNPKLIKKSGGIASIMRGLALQKAQAVDNLLVDGVRNFLFGGPGEGGFDLAALNIQRGRDHGIPTYNDTRRVFGLKRVKDFDEITSDPSLQDALESVYADVDDVDLWVGGLAEEHVNGALVGETFHTILVDQFTRLRDGDRFWYQNDEFFTSDPTLMTELENTTLADIIRRNTHVGNELQDNVFIVEQN
ncbi:MAG: peroxidase family protein [Terriglobia bacterium]